MFAELLSYDMPTSGMTTRDSRAFYLWYIASKFWTARRARHLVCHPACQLLEMLGAYGYAHGVDVQVHHKNYERVGNELESDLLTLCRNCHARYHDKIDVPVWAVVCDGDKPLMGSPKVNLAQLTIANPSTVEKDSRGHPNLPVVLL